MKVEDKIVKFVLEETGESKEEVFGPKRYPHLLRCRYVIAYFLHKEQWTLKEIARFLNRGHHTTIINMLKKVNENALNTQKLIEDVELRLRGGSYCRLYCAYTYGETYNYRWVAKF